MATKDREDRHQQQIPLRMRQSGSALRKLIRSVSAAGSGAAACARIRKVIPPGNSSKRRGGWPPGTDL